jgi:hypothetical protein
MSAQVILASDGIWDCWKVRLDRSLVWLLPRAAAASGLLPA